MPFPNTSFVRKCIELKKQNPLFFVNLKESRALATLRIQAIVKMDYFHRSSATVIKVVEVVGEAIKRKR